MKEVERERGKGTEEGGEREREGGAEIGDNLIMQEEAEVKFGVYV